MFAVPEVLAVSDGDDGSPPRLVLAWIDEGGRQSVDDEYEFGRRLARLHRAGTPGFGREDRRTTGSLALPNDPCTDWVEFFRDRRLTPLLRIARDRRSLPDDTLQALERTIDRLGDVDVPVEPPARLHGDLWAGNRLVDRSGRSWLIDPAFHGGHREYDLAMMRLFGGFGPHCFDGYDAEWPLADGWERRVPLHQLAPLVVHAIKFGGGYAAATQRSPRRRRSDLTGNGLNPGPTTRCGCSSSRTSHSVCENRSDIDVEQQPRSEACDRLR